MTYEELLYGVPAKQYQGLLGILNIRPLPAGQMTRQRRRAEQRQALKAG